MGYMKSIVDYCLSKGMRVLLDLFMIIEQEQDLKSVLMKKEQIFLQTFGVVWQLYIRIIQMFFLVL
jgi:hypothetical protein